MKKKFLPLLLLLTDWISLLLSYLCFMLLLLGGSVFYLGKVRLEIGQLDIWMLASLLFGFLYYRGTGQPPMVYQKLVKFQTFLQTNPDKAKKIAVLFLIYCLSMIFIAHVGKHWSFVTRAWDMGFIEPALFHPWRDRLLNCDICLNRTYLGEHLSFTLLLPALFLQFFPSSELVFCLEVVLAGAGLLILFRGIGLTQNGYQLLIGVLMILANRSFRNSLHWDFREDILAFFFLSMAIAFLVQGHWKKYLLSLLLVLLTKEHLPLVTSFIAIPILCEPQLPYGKKIRIRLATTTFVLSCSYLLIAFCWLIPYYSQGRPAENNIALMFHQYGKTSAEVLWNVATSPHLQWQIFVTTFTNLKNYKYLIIMLAPLLFLGYRRWYWLMPMAATMFLSIIAGSDNHVMMIFHYDLVLIPFAVACIGMSLRHQLFSSRKILWALIIAISLSGRWPGYYLFKWPFQRAASAWYLKSIPQDKIVLASRTTSAHLTKIKGIRIFNTPSECQEESCWRQFLAETHHQIDEGRTRPGDFDLIIFDLQQKTEGNLLHFALQNGYQLVDQAPDQSIAVVAKAP